jgi:2-keto-4-pentenoate hydratase/2-oxohepta-3-ene-1,7-dioic acid hydratase in catechol pathway
MAHRLVRVSHQGRPHWGQVLESWIEVFAGDPFAGLGATVAQVELAGARLLAPVTPSKILGVGTNYRAHALEMKKPLPDEPLLFMKPPTTVIAGGDAIVRPRGFERTDFEGELGVVIGRSARRVRERDALDYVLGYTIVNDVTVRDLQKKDGQFTRAKGFDTFCPVGPAIVTGLDPARLHVRTRQNGELRQDSPTSDLIFSVARVIETVTRVMTLEPGDLITTGTPSGVGPIAPGDVIEIEIEGIGTLRNPVEEEPV